MGPLDGVKVLDLTAMVSGPVAAMMLADQGAEVIKVEPPGGEQMRHVGALHNGEIAKWHREEILARLDAYDLPSAPLLTRMELLDHEQILVNGSIDHTKHEGCDHGVFRGTIKCRDQG